MQKRRSPILAGFLATILSAGLWAGGEQMLAHAQTTDKQTTPPEPAVRNSGQKSGEQVFMQNCARCHKPPMVISPRITGTIVMHMRVRARLSRQDEQALLRYLAP
jgi:cytochrome c5